jgi:TetR/AcrR family transcriptional regulator, transcriptional repressor for nem operon
MASTPLSKGEQTRMFVLGQAAALFNQRGYDATSLSDLMERTGLQKGGIYRHFESKQELKLAAFHYATDRMRERFERELEGRTSPLARIHGIILVYSRLPSDPPVPGGCPVLNAAVEADDADPELRAAARSIMDELRKEIASLTRAAQKLGELSLDVEPQEFAQVLMANLEGAVMLAKLYGSDGPMRVVQRHLSLWLQSLAPPTCEP